MAKNPQADEVARPRETVNSNGEDRFDEQRMEITGVVLIGLALLSLTAFFNGAGFIGDILKGSFQYVFGRRGAIFPVVFIGAVGWTMLRWRRGVRFSRHFLVLFLLFLWALLLLHLCSNVEISAKSWDTAVEGGGVVGHFMALYLLRWFGKVGTVIFMIAWLAVTSIIALDRPLIEVLLGVAGYFKLPSKPASFPTAETPEKPLAVPSQAEIDFEVGKELEGEQQPTDAKVIQFPTKERKTSSMIASLQNMLKEKEESTNKEGKRTRERPEPSLPLPLPNPHQPEGSASPYKLPDISLVGMSSIGVKKGNKSPDQARQLEETLANFGVQAKVIEVHQGPTVTRYDLQPAPGVKVSRIVNLTDDLALSLAAKGLRLEAPIPGKAAIGVEVPNQETQVVSFRDMLDSKTFWNSNKLTIALGMDIAGDVVVADLGKMPHLLIAGSTGSGKSVCVNTLIISVLYKAFPSEVKFIMIDPKMVELSMYNGIPHLMAPVVTEAKKAAGALKLVVDEMERRYRMFTEARVRDLEKYNEQQAEGEKLPFIVVLIDELADLMMVAPVEVEDSICRLAQMARATGIHLVVATQRPSVDVITGLIKANIPSRIAFAVSSQVDSRTILDSMGAERLLGRGDMLYSPVGAMKPRRVQGALVTEKEIEAVIKHWKEQGEPSYQEQFMNIPDREKREETVEEDDLFWEAVRIVVEYGQASASILQRRLRVGYTRAARLVDMMEAKGMVGAYEGSKPREVYITARQMEELKNRSQNK